LRSFADKPDSADCEAVIESEQTVSSKSILALRLAPAGRLPGSSTEQVRESGAAQSAFREIRKSEKALLTSGSFRYYRRSCVVS
jgi:hypothetical protein